MFKRGLLTAGLIAAGISTASAAPYGFSDARSVAMGNVSVATGGVTTAAFSNPAMLMINETDDTFALHVGAGVAGIEDGGITDDIDNFQALQDQIDAIVPTVNAGNVATTSVQIETLTNQQIDIFNNDLAGDSLLVRGSPNFALVYGGDSFALALTAEANAVASVAVLSAGGVPYVNAAAIAADVLADGTYDIQPNLQLLAYGYVTKEVGVSIASDFSLMGMKVSLGVKPKVISAEGINQALSLSTFDTADAIDTSTTDLGSFTTMDAGAVISFTDSLRVGVTAKNLIEDTLTSGATSVDFDTQMRVGAAYKNSFFTIAVDMDLTESDPILLEDPSKMMAVGIELNAFDFMQIRAGYQTNLASNATADDLISAGIGLWLGFNLDIAAVVSEDSVGAFVQTGFRF